jgi:hypothetical protein
VSRNDQRSEGPAQSAVLMALWLWTVALVACVPVGVLWINNAIYYYYVYVILLYTVSLMSFYFLLFLIVHLAFHWLQNYLSGDCFIELIT